MNIENDELPYIFIDGKRVTEFHGVSHPLDLKDPTEPELHATKEVIKLLEKNGCIPNATDSTNKEKALRMLTLYLREYVAEIGIKKEENPEIAKANNSQILPFGSYALGAHNITSDIDALCVTPSYIDKDDFFTGFYNFLKGKNYITEVSSVVGAYVPLVKLKFFGIPIDLIFASVKYDIIPEDFDLGTMPLDMLCSEDYTKSVNGRRVAALIMKLVPNVPVFQIALRFIKLWAKMRGLTSNVMGYFGGVAWAISVARVCQLFPNATAARAIYEYFRIASIWDWPHPMILTDFQYQLNGQIAKGSWDPSTNGTDLGHRMPIITPAYPTMCCTHNVTRSSHVILLCELLRGSEFALRATNQEIPWNKLLTPSNFFKKYSHYVQISAITSEETSHGDYAGLLESRVRKFTEYLDLEWYIEVLHIRSESMSTVHKCKNEEEMESVKAGKLDATPDNKDLPPNEIYKTLYVTSFYVGIGVKAESASEVDKLDSQKAYIRSLYKQQPDPEYPDKWTAIVNYKVDQLPKCIFEKKTPKIKPVLGPKANKPSVKRGHDEEETGELPLSKRASQLSTNIPLSSKNASLPPKNNVPPTKGTLPPKHTSLPSKSTSLPSNRTTTSASH